MMMRWTWSFIHSFHTSILGQSHRCRHFGCSCGDDGDRTFLRQQFDFFWQAFFVWASRRLTGQEVWGAVGALLVFQFYLHLNWRQGPVTKIFETTSNSTKLTSYSCLKPILNAMHFWWWTYHLAMYLDKYGTFKSPLYNVSRKFKSFNKLFS